MPIRLAASTFACVVALAYFGFAPQLARLIGDPRVTSRYHATDFVIFYCAGNAVRTRANPYTIEPLTACERSYWPHAYLPGYSEPAAYPGSTLALFALLALASFGVAKAIWLVVLCVGFGVTVWYGSLLSRAPPFAVAALLFVPVALLPIGVGQPAPIFCAAIAACASYARRGNASIAALCALAATIEPHVGIPVVVALAVLLPRARLTLALGGAALLALHVAALGPTVAASYVSAVLPAQAHSEYHAADQFGSVWWLAQLGVPSAAIAPTSALLYLTALASGIALAARTRARRGDAAALVTIPLVVALAFAPYLHDVELGVALVTPLAALAPNPRDLRWIACAVVLAVPWFAAARSPVLAATSVLCAALFVAIALRPRDRRAGEASLATALGLALLLTLAAQLPLAPGPTVAPRPPRSGALAAASWEAWIRSQPFDRARGPRIVLPKLITVAGLIAAAL
ncbi:MAG: hypothetical protein KGN02_09840 [bacterium]|nr:hypothetical protein [bacterium]